jgi:hypothetical protein
MGNPLEVPIQSIFSLAAERTPGNVHSLGQFLPVGVLTEHPLKPPFVVR